MLGPLSPAAKEWSESQFGLNVWDLETLLSKAQPFPELHRQLKDFATSIPARPSAPRDVAGNPGANLIGELQRHIQENTLTPSGYEELCRHVFVYVFDPHLYGFKRQAQTSDGSANRYDFICRIRSGQPFWDNLRADFHTKALLFECKNYNEKITADQVYSTERYLFTGALRTVYLISRLGPDDGCISAAQVLCAYRN